MKILISALIILGLHIQNASGLNVDNINYAPFGNIHLYYPKVKPSSLAIFVSGDGGWRNGVINMARSLTSEGAIIAGIDAKDYLKALSRKTSKCYYCAADFELLSIMLQKKFHFKNYTKPVLIGYSYGATLVYGILSQAPANTFKGAIALGFCPDIIINKPLCEGEGLSYHKLKGKNSYYLDKTENLSAPFIVLNGDKDKTCPFLATKYFLKNMKNVELVTLAKVGHGYSIADRWLPQFIHSYNKILEEPSYLKKIASNNYLANFSQNSIHLPGDLPLQIIPASINSNSPLFFMISGDGGWTSFDQSLAEGMSKKGISVIGLDAQKYFWETKTPQQTSLEIAKAINHYMQLWNKKSFVVAGYSFGANIVPFVVTQFPLNMRISLAGVCLLSPEESGDFEIHV